MSVLLKYVLMSSLILATHFSYADPGSSGGGGGGWTVLTEPTATNQEGYRVLADFFELGCRIGNLHDRAATAGVASPDRTQRAVEDAKARAADLVARWLRHANVQGQAQVQDQVQVKVFIERLAGAIDQINPVLQVGRQNFPQYLASLSSSSMPMIIEEENLPDLTSNCGETGAFRAAFYVYQSGTPNIWISSNNPVNFDYYGYESQKGLIIHETLRHLQWTDVDIDGAGPQADLRAERRFNDGALRRITALMTLCEPTTDVVAYMGNAFANQDNPDWLFGGDICNTGAWAAEPPVP